MVFNHKPASSKEVDSSVDRFIDILEGHKPWIEYHNQLFGEGIYFDKYSIIIGFKRREFPNIIFVTVYGGVKERLFDQAVNLSSIENFNIFEDMIENIFKAFYFAGNIMENKEIKLEYTPKQEGRVRTSTLNFFHGDIKNKVYIEGNLRLFFNGIKNDLLYVNI